MQLFTFILGTCRLTHLVGDRRQTELGLQIGADCTLSLKTDDLARWGYKLKSDAIHRGQKPHSGWQSSIRYRAQRQPLVTFLKDKKVMLHTASYELQGHVLIKKGAKGQLWFNPLHSLPFHRLAGQSLEKSTGRALPSLWKNQQQAQDSLRDLMLWARQFLCCTLTKFVLQRHITKGFCIVRSECFLPGSEDCILSIVERRHKGQLLLSASRY